MIEFVSVCAVPQGETGGCVCDVRNSMRETI